MKNGIRNLEIYERAKEAGNYIVEHNATVRQTAKAFKISKSTVHKDVTKKLEKEDPVLAKEVRNVLDINKEERHIRGGETTKRKFLKLN